MPGRKSAGCEFGHLQPVLVELDAGGGAGNDRLARGGAPESLDLDAEQVAFADRQIVARIAVGAGLFQLLQQPPLGAARKRHDRVVDGGREGRVFAQRHGPGQADIVHRLAREEERLHDHL